ncbi:hypothetical protein [Streptomyces sp. BE133]|uniref:hypothetical protein n=1 Tax=Streptomyces sp. BE133 TaxID=3002523 RepID=UPI002E7A0AC0|nr:hypothetical protein [Streptomyces sp. BE133]MEE1811820.1 hypothetical protein [Streptomyces sp. BE133]
MRRRLSTADYEQIVLQPTGAARAATGDVLLAADQLPEPNAACPMPVMLFAPGHSTATSTVNVTAPHTPGPRKDRPMGTDNGLQNATWGE